MSKNKLVAALRDFAQDLRKDATKAAAAVLVSPVFGSNPVVAGFAAVLVYAFFKAAPVLLEAFLRKD